MTRGGRRGAILRVLACWGAAGLAGCSLLQPAEPPMTSSLIDQLPSDLPHRPRGAATLVVLPPQAQAAYDTRQMAYRLRPHHIAYYSRNEWGERPAQMIEPLLLRAVEGTGAFAAVISPPAAGSHTLQTELLELIQDYESEPPVLRLVLRAQLQDAAGRKPIAAREFTLLEPMGEKTPYAGVLAANRAAARALRDIAAFVLEHAP